MSDSPKAVDGYSSYANPLSQLACQCQSWCDDRYAKNKQENGAVYILHEWQEVLLFYVRGGEYFLLVLYNIIHWL